MRYFTFIVAACLLATQASAGRESLHKAADCISDLVLDYWHVAIVHLAATIDETNPEDYELARAVGAEMRPVGENLDKEVREKLSRVDNDCEKGTPRENEKCYIRASLEYKTNGLEAIRKLAKTFIEALEKHSKPSGEAAMKRLKELVETMEAYFPCLERGLSECF